MDGLISLSFDLQLVLVAGYLAVKIATIGRAAALSTEEFLLRVLVFGGVARAGAVVVEVLTSFVPNEGRILPFSADLRAVAAGTLAVVIAIAAGMWWRTKGNRMVSRAMGDLRVYRDDHEETAWSSLINANAEWTLVYIHLQDGRILEAEFPEAHNAPLRPLTLNNDGVAIYVTGLHDTEGKFKQIEPSPGYGSSITFVPRDQIKQIDVRWKTPD